jgi:hypothetical protein
MPTSGALTAAKDDGLLGWHGWKHPKGGEPKDEEWKCLCGSVAAIHGVAMVHRWRRVGLEMAEWEKIWDRGFSDFMYQSLTVTMSM